MGDLSNLITIGEGAFSRCNELTKFELNEEVVINFSPYLFKETFAPNTIVRIDREYEENGRDAGWYKLGGKIQYKGEKIEYILTKLTLGLKLI